MTGIHVPCCVNGCKEVAHYTDVLRTRSLCERHRVLERLFAHLLSADDSHQSENKHLADFLWDIVDEYQDPEEMLEQIISSLGVFDEFMDIVSNTAHETLGAVRAKKGEDG